MTEEHDDAEAKEHHGLLFDVRRSVRYHNRRRAFFDRMSMLNTAISLVFGSAAAASVLGDRTILAVSSGLIVTVCSSIDLVVGSAQKARLHYDLARRFIELEKQLVAMSPEDSSALCALKQTRLSIEADEPPVYRALDLLCRNEQLAADGWKRKKNPEQFSELTRCQRWTSQFLMWSDLGAA